ncbi:MAG: hypothetical protein M1594_01770 [Candidatus Marsarchaeota archaeon]|nr:hypothetical protein [Candidatus Marsarchaeota archaeon]
MILKLKEPLNLDFTLNSGQVFNWREKEGVWQGFIKGKKVRIKKSGENLFFEGVDKNEISSFFKLEENLDDIYNSVVSKSRDKLVEELLKKYRGLRVLRQDPWECLISFITSQNSSIKTIKKRVKSLYDLNDCFPSAETLSSFSESYFEKIGFGYRSKYIKKTSEIVANGFDLEGIKKKSFDNALEELKSLPGVGDKVAKCVMLFSLDFTEAFPVDVHIERIMKKVYHREKNIQEFAVKRFGSHAGYVQQYLFFSDVF